MDYENHNNNNSTGSDKRVRSCGWYPIAGTGAKDETTVLESSKRGWLGEWNRSRVGIIDDLEDLRFCFGSNLVYISFG
jgi:hypothetical protein